MAEPTPAAKKPKPKAPPRRVRTPNILQMEAVECGAGALAIVLGYYRKFVPLEELRVACGVSRDGSKASNIIKAARKYGLTAKGFKKEPAGLRQLAVPMIVHWNFNHFVVVEGFAGQRVFINDPALGPLEITAEELDKAFTGVVLTFEPTDQLVAGGEKAGLIKPLRRRAQGLSAALGFVVLAGLALVVPGLVAPTFTRVFVDQVLVKGLEAWMRPLLLFMAATAFVLGALTALQGRYLLRLETRLSLGHSSRFFWHVLRLPIEFFNQRYAGEIGNRVQINDRVAVLLSRDLATTALNLMVVVIYALLMLQYDLVLSLISVVTAVINVLALRYVAARRTVLSQRMLQDRGKLMGTAMGGLQTIETLKAGGSESDFFARWAGYQAKVVNANQGLQLTELFLGAVPPLLLSVNVALVLGIGGLRVIDGHLTMGMLVAFESLTLAFLAPVNRMVGLGGQLQELQSGLNRLDDVLRAPVDPGARDLAEPREDDAPAAADGARLEGYLTLREVSFGYSRLDPPLIDRLSLELRPGSRVALVGGSGSGKSTVAKLVAGLYEPWTGEILFDGRPRVEVPRPVLSQSLAVVDQDISMFEGTLRDNLTLWDPTVSEQRLTTAAKDACIHDDITARPGGYGATMEEAGRNFSGGQRQRLEIARALVVDPRILVLAEATSALDPTTEKLIDDNLRRRGCTCLIVAHRLSTIRDCDEIIVLEKGQVVQRGTHAELVAQGGTYAKLIASE
ncbi:MAG TPA: NHLP family bacteriocin export ABC transporter peptidase/permease/ATPase subunit [Kofleriaceae bacterium]|nr:NHLP family bacteriocin export ABC transporter peptidase/permease/ATPase subunit [Kofleriaceae bacterium]